MQFADIFRRRSCRSSTWRFKRRKPLSLEPLEAKRVLATFVVTSLNDAGEGTLRQQVDRANASGGFDEIVFDSSLAGSSIQLASEILITETARVDATDLLEGITIDLNAADPTPAENNGDGIRAFHSQLATFYYGGTEFHGLTITGGDVAGRGGAIFGAQLIADSTFIDNAAADGGAVAIEQNTNNPATFERTIRDSVFKENSASQHGGAIWTSIQGLGTLNIDKLQVSNNTAADTGGGLYLSDEAHTTSVGNSILANNVAGTAGAISADTYSGNIHIQDCSVLDNSATEYQAGGILTSTNYGSVVVENCSISGNFAQGNGGGIVVSGAGGTIRSSHIEFNFAYGNGGGASIEVSEQGGAIVDSTINANTATSGGGVNFSLNDADASIVGSTVSGNLARSRGGGVRHAASYSPLGSPRVSVSYSTISDNVAERDGGGLFAVNMITNSTISGNTAWRKGGGIVAYGSTIFFTTIVQNVASADPNVPQMENGGGVWARNGQYGSTPTSISHSIIASNLLVTGETVVKDDLNGDDTIEVNYSLVEAIQFGGLTGDNNLFDQDPLLGQLADNGGNTRTHKPLLDSPVIDRGNPALLWNGEYDQRGEPFGRFRDGNVPTDIAFDLGAVEIQGVNLAPIADAGADQMTKVDVFAALDGTNSSDPDKGPTPLRYSWEVIEGPMFIGGFDDSLIATPMFTTDTTGDYVLELTVSDGNQSDSDTMTLTVVENSDPIALTDGSDLATIIGVPGLFDGAMSFDPDGDDVASYRWRLVDQPTDSTVTLAGANTVSPSLDPDLAGIYDVELVVTDPSGNASQPAMTRLSVEAGPVSAGGPYVSEALADVRLTVLATEPFIVFSWDLDGDGDFADAVGRSPEVDASIWRAAIIETGSSILQIGVLAIASDTTTSIDYGTVSFRSGEPAGWYNEQNPLDVDGDQVASPIDALLTINELNDRIFTDTNGVLPPSPSSELDLGNFTLLDAAPGFLDTNNDGIISPIDPLLVINGLPTTSAVSARVHDELFSAGLDDMSVVAERTGWITHPTLADDDEDEDPASPFNLLHW